jgi:dTDP-4-amino-4,6-dideoxygalactose transaminase
VDRGLALRNLKTAEVVHAKRLELARRYQEKLAGAKGLLLPPVSPFALSHFTVRVDAGIRNRLKEELYRRGIYTISLWTFSAYLDPQEFPNAARICNEVINLPLSPWMTGEQVDEVCEQLLLSLRKI